MTRLVQPRDLAPGRVGPVAGWGTMPGGFLPMESRDW